jgi:hypothetical protein
VAIDAEAALAANAVIAVTCIVGTVTVVAAAPELCYNSCNFYS